MKGSHKIKTIVDIENRYLTVFEVNTIKTPIYLK